MSAKKSNSKSLRDSSQVDSTHHRPIAFVWVVAVAGSLSTWFWYRPIPKHAIDVANRSVWNQAAEKESIAQSKWHDSGLIQPSLATPEARTYGASLSSTRGAEEEPVPGHDDSLTGSGELALTPFQDRIRPLNEWVSGEPLPMVPIESSSHAARGPLPSPTLWTNTPKVPSSSTQLDLGPPPRELPSSTSNLASEAASPFRVPTVNRAIKSVEEPSLITNIWPDQGYVPFQPRPNSTVATRGSGNAPHGRDSVIALSSNRIQTLDREIELPKNPANVPGTVQSQPAWSDVPKQQPNVPRQPPAVIRQPRPRDGSR